jgi:hypothetical protein
MSMKRFLKWYFIAPAAIVGFVAFVALGGAIIVWLWNSLLPTLFNLPTITFWQGLGLLALCRILFGGFGMGGSRGPRHMTRAERERFRERMRERYGRPAGESPQ